MTRETVAGESARCSARNFRLTDGAEAFPRGREDATVFDRFMGCFVGVVSHKAKGRASVNANFFATFWSPGVEIKGPQTKKSIYHGVVRFIPSLPTILLTMPSQRVFHAPQGRGKSIY
jgi:hypothetical protein